MRSRGIPVRHLTAFPFTGAQSSPGEVMPRVNLIVAKPMGFLPLGAACECL